MKHKPAASYIYTNIGLKHGQHKLLKHLAVEESRDMASLIRDAVDQYVERKNASGISYEQNFIFSLGAVTADRPYDPKNWSAADKDLYGGD